MLAVLVFALLPLATLGNAVVPEEKCPGGQLLRIPEKPGESSSIFFCTDPGESDVLYSLQNIPSGKYDAHWLVYCTETTARVHKYTSTRKPGAPVELKMTFDETPMFQFGDSEAHQADLACENKHGYICFTPFK